MRTAIERAQRQLGICFSFYPFSKTKQTKIYPSYYPSPFVITNVATH